MIYDKNFLLQLDKEKNKIIHARITALTFDEQPIETIEGRVTQGSITVDGNSAVRRTCSLTMVAKNFNSQNYYWGLNTKFKLEVGVENYVDRINYPDIIWFKQGIFVFTSFNTSRNASSFTISLQGKDKMCLLNGEVGGSLEASIDFANIEEENSDGVWTITPIPIYEIIRNAVHTYAGEPYHNIIINDIEDYGLELLEYRYDLPLFLYRKADEPSVADWNESAIFDNILMGGNLECKVDRYDEEVQEYFRVETTVNELLPTELDMLVDSLMGTSHPAKVWIYEEQYKKDMPWYFARVDYGQTAGYRLTDLTYAGDLIANIGESITSVLDKIKNMLSEFEYFYDLDGQFVFQRKKAFINTLWSPQMEGETEEVNESGESTFYSEKYIQSIAEASSWAYVFNDAELISAFNNNPNLLNMRNDFSVWGTRKSISGADIPVHMRYAIDMKPSYYKNIAGQIFMTDRSVIEAMKEAAKKDIADSYFQKIKDFTIAHPVPPGFEVPVQQEDGSWSRGWWDIRDWYEYYELLAGEGPKYTMKWYSQNDETGVIPVWNLPGYGPETHPNYKNCYAWTVTTKWITDEKGEQHLNVGIGHGSGMALSDIENAAMSTRYESYYDSKGERKDILSLVKATVYDNKEVYYMKDDNNQNGYVQVDSKKKLTQSDIDSGLYYVRVRKPIIYPYNGCSDWHTYLYFFDDYVQDGGYQVLFFNPRFPDYESYEDLIFDKIEKEYEEYEKQGLLNYVDWREIIYQMAKDYYKNNTLDDFELLVKSNNEPYYTTGKTGYERYYIDLEGFWRQIYNPFFTRDINKYREKRGIAITNQEFVLGFVNNVNKSDSAQISYIESKYDALIAYDESYDYSFFSQNEETKGQFLTSQLGAFNKTMAAELETIKQQIADYEAKIVDLEEESKNYYPDGHKNEHWLTNVYEYPETINFWFDFLDAEGELSQFNVKNVGARSKAVNETTIKSIYFRETPDVIFKSPGEDIEPMSGYKYIQVQDIDTMFSISAQGKSAKDRLDELIYQHGYCVENATITTIPIYYLEPNVRVHIHDEETNINGDYIVSKMTIPLAYNGTMQLTATKAAESII